MDELMRYWPAIAFLAGLLLAAAGWAIRKGLASRDELQAEATARAAADASLETRITDKLAPLLAAQIELSNRTLRIETEIRHLPSAEDIADVKEQLGRADARLESLDREMQSITRALTRVENHLLKGAMT
jgi:chromosome segregation ATPase